MKLNNFPWFRVGLSLVALTWGYIQFTKDPIVYQKYSISEVQLNDKNNYYEISGIPQSVNSHFSENNVRLSMVLSSNDKIIIANSKENNSFNMEYLMAESLIEYYINKDDTTKIYLKGELKKDNIFDFKLSKNLENMFK